MNTEKTLKNSIVSVTCQIITLLLQFINRKVFVIFLDIEYLGYQSLFGNIFTILSVAELGIGNIITFHLYKEIVDCNEEEIGKLMYLYKWVYRFVAVIVLVCGCCLLPFIPYIVKNSTQSWSYLYLIYALLLLSTILGYFLSYRRAIYIANQKEYYCVTVDLYTQIVIQVIQLSTLAFFKNYILYLIIQLSTTIIANIIIACKSNKDYPFLKKKYTVKKQEIIQRNMISDVKNFLVHKVAYAIYGGTDNVIISALCGIRNVAIYGNYVLLKNGVMNVLFYKLLNPVQATIGNIVHGKKSLDDQWEQFCFLDVFSFFFATYIGLGFLLFYQPIISIWMGKEYLLPTSFVIVFVFTIYFGAVFEIVYKYRSVFGDYAQDRNCMVLSAILNIIVSVLAAKKFDVTGVQIGTLIGLLPMVYGRIRFVVNNYFGRSHWKYICKHMLLSLLAIAEYILAYRLAGGLPVTIMGLIIRTIIWFFVPLIINCAVFWKNKDFKLLQGYIKKTIIILLDKIHIKK